MITFTPRATPSRFWQRASPFLALILTAFSGGALFAALGQNPLSVLSAIFVEPLIGEFAWYYRPQLLIKGAPLVLIAIGLAIGFRASIWNIGAEGQYILGAIFAAALALSVYPVQAWWLFPAMIVAGALGGALWALIPALLKVRFGANEILVSLMMVYIAEFLLASMATGALRNPEGSGFPGSRNLRQYEAAANTEIWQGSGVHWGVVFAVLAVALAALFLQRHRFGFAVRLAGEAPRAAGLAGVVPGRMVVLCMMISGALAGLAGMFEVTGPAGQITIDFNSNYGFTAIIVAFLGRLNPAGILAAGLLLALTYVGGEIAQTSLGLPRASIQVFQGMLLFFLLAADFLTRNRVAFGRRKAL